MAWKRGDLFVFPMTPKNEAITHRAHDNGAALYFVRMFTMPSEQGSMLVIVVQQLGTPHGQGHARNW